MGFEVTAKASLLSVKYWSSIIVCWPPPRNATRRDLIIHNMSWCVAFCFPLSAGSACVLDAIRGPSDPGTIVTHLAEIAPVMAVCAKMLVSLYYQSHLRTLCADLQAFVDTAGERELAKMEQCAAKYGKFLWSNQLMAFLAVIAFCLGPLTLDQPLPAHSDYPFEWRDSPKLIALLTLTQVIAIFQVAAMTVLDQTVSWLLCAASSQFEILAEDLQGACTFMELRECFKRHQKLLIHGEDIMPFASSLAVTMIILTGLTNICGGYQFVSQVRMEVLGQYICMVFVSSLEVAVFAWPAEQLITATENVSWAIYCAPWVDKSELAREIRFTMMRSQKPIAIAIRGFADRINMDFYGKYLTTTFSYFTTLRAFVD